MTWNPFKKGDSLLDAVDKSSKLPNLSQPTTINPALDTNQMKTYQTPTDNTRVAMPDKNLINSVIGRDNWAEKVTDAPTDYEEMVQEFGDRWKTDESSMTDFMNKISYHETDGTLDPKMHQYEGGQGRGLFQYEMGKDKGGMTARNRLEDWYQMHDKEVPEWLMQNNMDEIGFDASRLTDEQQRMLFLADKRFMKDARLDPESTQDAGEWWANYHWKGTDDKRGERIKKFESDEDDWYDEEYIKGTVTEAGSDAFPIV